MPPKPRNRDRLSVYLVSVLLFVGGALLALLVTRGYAVDFDSFTLQKRGVVVLHSNPDAAAVTLNGTPSNKQTDARFSLAPDTYRFEVRTPGRVPWAKEVDLSPGEAVIEEITLFPESPERTALTTTPVRQVAVSADGGRIAAVVRRDAARELRLLDGQGENLFKVRLAAEPRMLAVTDEGFVLAEAAGRIAVYDPAGKRVGNITGTNGGFTGDRIVFQQDRRIISADQAGQNRRTLARTSKAWIPTDSRVYVLSTDGTLVTIEPGQEGEPVAGAGTISTITPIGPDAIQATKPDGSFGVIRDGTFKAIAQGPARVTLSSDGIFVAYRTNREVRLYDLGTGRDRLVTSLTKPPARVTALPGGYYLLYRQGTALHAMARDGSNDRVVAGRVGSEPIVVSLDRILARDSRTGRLTRINLRD